MISTKGLTADLINKYSINAVKYFYSNGLQNYLVFVSTIFSINYISDNTNKIKLWDSTRMSRERINTPHTSETNFCPESIDKKYI